MADNDIDRAVDGLETPVDHARILPGDLYHAARYAELCEAFGGEPDDLRDREVLIRLTAWTDNADTHALARMITEARTL